MTRGDSERTKLPADDEVTYLRDYVDAVGESSQRSRTIVIVLMASSILCFIAFWNSVTWSWGSGRVSHFESVLTFWPLEKKEEELLELKSIDESAYNRYIEAVALARQHGYDPTTLAHGGFSASQICQLKENIKSIIDVKYEQLQEIRASNVINVRVPFFGIFFDINDLGLFGGITFLAILLMARYSLLREYENLRFLARQASDETDLDPYYALLATRQVLTVPPRRPGESKFWAKLPRLVLWLPVIVLFMIFSNDGITFGIGAAISKPLTMMTFSITGLLLAFNIVLAFNCNKYWRYIDIEWNIVFGRIIKDHNEDRFRPILGAVDLGGEKETLVDKTALPEEVDKPDSPVEPE